MKTILIVHDEPAARHGLRSALEGRYRIVEADSAAAGRSSLVAEKPDLLLLDVVLPEEQGLSFLRWLRKEGYELPVLMVSSPDTAQSAVEVLQLGAADYLVRGFERDELRQRLANLLKWARLEQENVTLRRRLATEGNFGLMIGRSAGMRRAFEMADRVAPTDSAVLILGESGTGKDLLAQEIHARSPRNDKAYVAVNCAALPETLIESELFGYERGAFTVAAQQKKGTFEQASSGTLFLDEIGDMNPVTQSKVLRALENRTIERLGGAQAIPVDVRVISATHRNLNQAIRDGKFREDLFNRLRLVTIELPSLRTHKEDIAALAEAFLQIHRARLSRAGHLTKEALTTMERYDWPGNVRELKNALERSLVLCRNEEIAVRDLPEEVVHGSPGLPKSGEGSPDFGLQEKDYRAAKRKFEAAYLLRQLGTHRWNISRTAATIGLHRQSLQERLRELGIRRPGPQAPEDDE